MSTKFTKNLITWQKQFGRHNLPWQVTNPYYIWLSEVMLQQTQVSTVLKYYPKFIQYFPTVYKLAQATEDEVLSLWAGLGYYSRARNLHHAAQYIINELHGHFPQTRQDWEKIKGVGRSTAAAIVAFAYHHKETILDGNVKRVLCRTFALFGKPEDKTFEKQLWDLAENLLPNSNELMPSYIQGLMDLGALICTRNKPKCQICPQCDICIAFKKNWINTLPQKKTPLKINQINMIWLIIINNQREILLSKRPSSGIWGGLMCVPCLNDWQQFSDFCLNNPFQLSLNLDEAEPLTEFTHRLTHRLLSIRPYILYTEQSHPNFISLKQIQTIGMPKPLQQLIKNI